MDSATVWDWAKLSKYVLRGNEEAIASVVLYLMEHPDLPISLPNDEEAQLLAAALQQRPYPVWELIADRLEAGSWHLESSIEKWLLSDIDTTPVQEWVGSDIGRARIVARITHPGTDQPTPLTRYLLQECGGDDDITSGLYGQLVTGVWSERTSDRLQWQIRQLDSWRQDHTEPREVRQWAARATNWLIKARLTALEQEAERYP